MTRPRSNGHTEVGREGEGEEEGNEKEVVHKSPRTFPSLLEHSRSTR